MERENLCLDYKKECHTIENKTNTLFNIVNQFMHGDNYYNFMKHDRNGWVYI